MSHFTVSVGPGMKIGSYLDDAREYMKAEPRLVGKWSRADAVFGWVGSIVRTKARYWKTTTSPSYGIVLEVGKATWLGVLWANEGDSRQHVGSEVDCWHYPELDSMRTDIFRRRLTDEQLREFARKAGTLELIPSR